MLWTPCPSTGSSTATTIKSPSSSSLEHIWVLYADFHGSGLFRVAAFEAGASCEPPPSNGRLPVHTLNLQPPELKDQVEGWVGPIGPECGEDLKATSN